MAQHVPSLEASVTASQGSQVIHVTVVYQASSTFQTVDVQVCNKIG